jgi:hypothetical protein
VSDDQQSVESTADEQSSASAEHDEVAESFLQLEAELDVEQTADRDETATRRGIVVDNDRVDTSEVPEEYPVDVNTDAALALTVDLGDEETTVYFAWADDATANTRLTRLLAALEIDPGDLYGQSLLLERIDGHDVAVTPTEQPRGTEMWGARVTAGHGANALVLSLLTASAVGVTVLPTVLLLLCWLFVTLLWLPYTTYQDAWYLRTHTEWQQGPLFWAFLSAIPVLNLPVGLLYLRSRSTTTALVPE